MKAGFSTPISRDGDVLAGPWRGPRQMLSDQAYDGHASIHDDGTAQALGFRGGTIEGPTHFSQVAPLACELWGERFLSEGCISAHYRNAVYEGEEVRALLTPTAADQALLRMEKRDGTEVLAGTVGIGASQPASALEQRLEALRPPGELVILQDVRIGMKTGRIPVAMGADQHMGDLYPFTLRQKLERITEPSPLYDEIIPFEMISVLLGHVSREQPFPVRGPAVGLFADQEIRLFDGPLRVGEAYEIEREVIAISDSRRTESSWIRTRVYRPSGDVPIATMLLNSAVLKQSYAPYETELAALREEARHV
jgi:hypothetical protein